MIKMNKKAFPKLGSLYEAIYRPVYRKNLPKFCLPEISLPIVCIANHQRAAPELSLSQEIPGPMAKGFYSKNRM